MALQALSIDLVAQLARFSADMRQAATVSQQTGRQISNGLGVARSALEGLAAGVTFAGLIQLTRATIDSIDRLNDLKDATGASIEKLSGLEDVAARTGTSFDTVGDSLLKFNTALKDAKPGSDAEAAFKSLGLSVAELKRLDPAEALRQTAIAMAGFADDGNKARLSQELFGRSLREVAPFLKNLADAGELVTKVTAEQAQEAENFNRELLAIQKNAQDLARVLASDFVTAINRAASAMRDGGFIEGLKTLFGGDATHRQNVRLSELTNDLLDAEAKLSKFKGSDNFFARGLAAGAQKEVDGIKKAISEIQRLRDVGNPDNQSAAETARLFGKGRPSIEFNGAIKPVKLPKLGKSGDDITDAQRELARYVDQLQGAIEKTQNLTEQEKALNFLRQLGTTGQIPQVRELVLGMAQQIDAEKALKAATEERIKIGREAAIEAGNRVTEENRAYQERLARLTDGAESNVFKRQQEDLQFLKDSLDKGAISLQIYSESVRDLFSISGEGFTKLTTFAEEAAKNIQASLGAGLADILNGNFDNIGKSFTQLINRMVAEAAAAKITESLFGKGGSGGGAFGDVLGSFGKLLGFDGGGDTGNGPRIGGIDGKGGFLAVMHPQETVIDRTRGQQSAGSGRLQNITINPPPGMGRTGRTQFAAQMARELRLADAYNN